MPSYLSDTAYALHDNAALAGWRVVQRADLAPWAPLLRVSTHELRDNWKGSFASGEWIVLPADFIIDADVVSVDVWGDQQAGASLMVPMSVLLSITESVYLVPFDRPWCGDLVRLYELDQSAAAHFCRLVCADGLSPVLRAQDVAQVRVDHGYASNIFGSWAAHPPEYAVVDSDGTLRLQIGQRAVVQLELPEWQISMLPSGSIMAIVNGFTDRSKRQHAQVDVRLPLLGQDGSISQIGNLIR